MPRRSLRALGAAVTLQVGAAGPLVAQDVVPAGGPEPTLSEAAPIACWRRTSSGAVRVGEHFRLVLTCAVVETEATVVVADVARLDPAVLQIPPFDVLGGTRAADLRTAVRRFMQFEYTLRVINDDVIGEDVVIPELTLGYRVQSRASQGAAAIESRELQYILPSLPVRVMSLVPVAAAEIRDQPSAGFGEVEARRFRARALTLLAIALFSLGGITLLFAIVRVRQGRGHARSGRRPTPIGAILRGVDRELTAVARGRNDTGWKAESIGRALGALRVAAAHAVSRPLAQVPFVPGATLSAGQLLVRHGAFGRRAVIVSASATPELVSDALQRDRLSEERRALLAALTKAMHRMTKAAYGRNGTAADATELSAALTNGQVAVRQLVVETGPQARARAALRRPWERLQRAIWTR